MEKFQIAKYGMMQVVALAYGILSCGTAVKICRPLVESGYPMPAIYWGARFDRVYGLCVFMLVVGWTAFAAYYSSSFPKRNIDERWLTGSGMLFFVLLLILGTILAFGTGVAATMPHDIIQPA